MAKRQPHLRLGLARVMSNILLRASEKARRLAQIIYLSEEQTLRSQREKRVLLWYRNKGDETHRLNYEMLNEKSIVFDLGGYKGQWASDIFAKYCSNINVFEPVSTYTETIRQRFAKNPKIRVYPFGLSMRNGSQRISIDENSSSLFKESAHTENIELVCFDEFVRTNKISKIDLIKINIEGGEYDLLDHILDTGQIRRITNLQIQFHDFVPNAKQRMLNIQKRLALTHKTTYQYEFVWENWESIIEP